ncbi:hypothetical protein G9X67_09915 [Rhizobium sp. WYCCWR 11152]|nr:hypothetical protein [Rhizobium sp. WYCCWR 11152]
MDDPAPAVVRRRIAAPENNEQWNVDDAEEADFCGRPDDRLDVNPKICNDYSG